MVDCFDCFLYKWPPREKNTHRKYSANISTWYQSRLPVLFFGNPKNLRFLCSLSDSGAARPLGIFFFSDHQASPVVISDLIGSPGFAGDHLGFLSHRISSPGIAGDQLGISEPLPICKLSSRRICNLGSPRGGSRISPVLSLGSRISDLSPNHWWTRRNSHWWTLGSRFRWNRRRKKSSSSLLSISPAGFWSRVFS